MKNLIYLLAVIILASCGGASNQEQGSKTKAQAETIAPTEGKVMVYYFHGKQRCRSCIAIQNVSEQAVSENFADNANVMFVEVDFSERANQALADRYEVAFSSLIIATPNAHTNLTNEAFANALNNPDALKGMITEAVNGYLN